MKTVDELVREAFAAILRGDLAERDRLCALATNILNAKARLAEGGPLMVGEPIKLEDGLSIEDKIHLEVTGHLPEDF